MWLTLNQILTAFGSKTKAPLKVLLKNATFASGLKNEKRNAAGDQNKLFC